MFSRLMNSYYYGKSGKGDYRKEDLPKNRWQLFWEMLRVRLSGICRLNLTVFAAWIPTMIVLVILINAVASASDIQQVTDENGNSYSVFVYAEQVDDAGNVLSPASSAPVEGIVQMSLLLLIPCILITGPVQAGMAYVTRNWARDEHAFAWGDFKDAAKDNWKQALGVSAITAVLPFILFVCYRFYGQMMGKNVLFMVPQMLTLGLGLVWYLGLVFMYPLMVKNGPELRKKLIGSRIYVPKLWPMDYHSDLIETERRLADNILPIPCDQRYTAEDMRYISSVVHNYLNA